MKYCTVFHIGLHISERAVQVFLSILQCFNLELLFNCSSNKRTGYLVVYIYYGGLG